MKFLCNRRDFLADCLLVSGGVSRDGITRNIKAIVESGHCTLMATDLEIAIRLEVRVRVENDGAAILPAARLIDILREATDDEMMIDASKGLCNAIVTCNPPATHPPVTPFLRRPISALFRSSLRDTCDLHATKGL